MKKLASILVAVIVIGGGLALAGLKWWSVLWPGKVATRCSTRFDCRSYLCLRHELVGGGQAPSEGYCTTSCETDGDCDGLACVAPGPAADDLPAIGRPDRLCMRRR